MSYWACARLEQNRTGLAHHFLGLNGFQTYCPYIRVERRASPEPMFIGYTFVAIELQWHGANRCPGVIHLIMHDGHPARVPDTVITDLKARERDGLIQLPKRPRFLAGDQVRIIAGAFQGQLAVFAGMRPRERVEVLLGILGAERRLELGRRDIRPAT